MPDAYVIFITESDVFKEGRSIYNVERSINESGKAFGDGSHIVYVNAACQDDTPLGRLMQDFNCNDPAKMHYKELADRVNYFKTSKEGEIDMTDIIEAYANNKAKEVAEKAAKKMLADGMSLEAVVRYSDLSEEEVRALAAKQSA